MGGICSLFVFPVSTKGLLREFVEVIIVKIIVVCLSLLFLRQIDDLTRVYPASRPMVPRIGYSPLAYLIKIRRWMDNNSADSSNYICFKG